ncbi:MAG: HD domain-containing protein [Isosphaeraceae bacterium]|nr:HD domain-containing protein [Isosphaeraceae bacterium]
MAGTDTAVIRLSELQDGQEAECFAALVKKVRGITTRDQPYLRCYFRDKRVVVECPIWADNRFFNQAQHWVEGIAYRLRVKGELKPKYGMQLQIIDIRPAKPEDAADGYDFFDLVESSDFPVPILWEKLRGLIDRYIEEPCLRQLLEAILTEHGDLFRKMPAAQGIHHSYTSGLLEHVWSMTRVAALLADHYARYYNNLNPPLNKGVVVAAAILHDIGKLRELEYHPVEAKYTKHGNLIGHILMGRDLVREAARAIADFPEETLLLLEHAILAHHGKAEYGAPKAPMTLEALIVHYADELDAKINAVAREFLRPSPNNEPFTDKIFAVDNRRFYRGIPIELPSAEDDLPPSL